MKFNKGVWNQSGAAAGVLWLPIGFGRILRPAATAARAQEPALQSENGFGLGSSLRLRHGSPPAQTEIAPPARSASAAQATRTPPPTVLRGALQPERTGGRDQLTGGSGTLLLVEDSS